MQRPYQGVPPPEPRSSKARGSATLEEKRSAKKESQKGRWDKADKSTPSKTLGKLTLMAELEDTAWVFEEEGLALEPLQHSLLEWEPSEPSASASRQSNSSRSSTVFAFFWSIKEPQQQRRSCCFQAWWRQLRPFCSKSRAICSSFSTLSMACFNWSTNHISEKNKWEGQEPHNQPLKDHYCYKQSAHARHTFYSTNTQDLFCK